MLDSGRDGGDSSASLEPSDPVRAPASRPRNARTCSRRECPSVAAKMPRDPLHPRPARISATSSGVFMGCPLGFFHSGLSVIRSSFIPSLLSYPRRGNSSGRRGGQFSIARDTMMADRQNSPVVRPRPPPQLPRRLIRINSVELRPALGGKHVFDQMIIGAGPSRHLGRPVGLSRVRLPPVSMKRP